MNTIQPKRLLRLLTNEHANNVRFVNDLKKLSESLNAIPRDSIDNLKKYLNALKGIQHEQHRIHNNIINSIPVACKQVFDNYVNSNTNLRKIADYHSSRSTYYFVLWNLTYLIAQVVDNGFNIYSLSSDDWNNLNMCEFEEVFDKHKLEKNLLI